MSPKRYVHHSDKKSYKSRQSSNKTEGQTINQKLEKLARANYRNTLKRQAFRKLQAYFCTKETNKRATEYYINRLLGRMVRNW